MHAQVSAVATGTQVATRLLHFLHPSSLLSEAPLSERLYATMNLSWEMFSSDLMTLV